MSLVFCAPSTVRPYEFSRNVRFLNSGRNVDQSSRISLTNSAFNNYNDKIVTKMVPVPESNPYVRRLEDGKLKILYRKPQRGKRGTNKFIRLNILFEF